MSMNANDHASTAPDADLPPQPAGEAEAAQVKGGAADIFRPQPVQGVLIGLLLPAMPVGSLSTLPKY